MSRRPGIARFILSRGPGVHSRQAQRHKAGRLNHARGSADALQGQSRVENRRTGLLHTERLFAAQRFTKTLCATFCATFAVAIPCPCWIGKKCVSVCIYRVETALKEKERKGVKVPKRQF
jgi:hypothetical protein